MIELDGQKTLYFYMVQIAGKRNFQCTLRYLEAPKQAHFGVKNNSRTRNT